MDIIKLNGEKLVEAIPEEPYIGNMVRKILKIIREEHISESKNKSDKGPQTSLDKFIKALKIMNVDFTIPVPTLKNALIDSINEFEMEVESWLATLNTIYYFKTTKLSTFQTKFQCCIFGFQ